MISPLNYFRTVERVDGGDVRIPTGVLSGVALQDRVEVWDRASSARAARPLSPPNHDVFRSSR